MAGQRDIQRYSLEVDEAGQGYHELDPEGRWVLFKEVAALSDALDGRVVDLVYKHVHGHEWDFDSAAFLEDLAALS